MPLDNLPGAILPAIELCDTEGKGTNFIGSLQTRCSSFDPDCITQTPAVSDGDWVEGDVSLKKASQSPIKARTDLCPAVLVSTPCTHDGHIIGVGIERLKGFRVPSAYLLDRKLHMSHCLLKVAGGPPFHGTEVTAFRIFGWRILRFSKGAGF